MGAKQAAVYRLRLLGIANLGVQKVLANSINTLTGTPASNKVGVLASSAIFLEWHEHNLACSRRSKR